MTMQPDAILKGQIEAAKAIVRENPIPEPEKCDRQLRELERSKWEHESWCFFHTGGKCNCNMSRERSLHRGMGEPSWMLVPRGYRTAEMIGPGNVRNFRREAVHEEN